MNSKTTKAKYLKFAILIISICFLLGAISACLPFNISVPELNDNVISDTAVNITQNANDGLGEFNDGLPYVFTDKTLIDDFRAGNASTPYDITMVKVDTSKERGAQANPYVISTTADWETFVKKMESDTTRGSGQYFVLGADLDFTDVTFHPVRFFNGTFYGMGHSIKNISCDTWQYYNGSTLTNIGSTTNGFGLFCRITNATITDLIVDNFSYRNMPQTSSIGSTVTRSVYVGGVAGMSSGDDYILNCQTRGEITSTIKYTGWPVVGGILGGKLNIGVTSSPLMIYRCSSEFQSYINADSNSNGHMSGGIMGDGGNSANNFTLYIYDCVANVTSRSDTRAYISSIVGSVYHTSYIENAIGLLDITCSSNPCSGVLTALSKATNTTNNINVKNLYVEGNTGANSSSKKSMFLVSINTGVTITANQLNNVNIVKTSSSYVPCYFTSNWTNGSSVTASAQIEHSSSSAMNTDAKTFFGSNYSQIWDTSKIGTDYAPDNSPVRNYLVAFVDFRNIINGGENIEKDVEKVGLDDGLLFYGGDKLPDVTSNVSAFTTYLNNKKNSNHEFLGWTDDPTGESKPFLELPLNVYGYITLYAVWGLPDSYVTSNIKTSLSADKNTIEYDSVESITLTAKVEHTGTGNGYMTNPSVTYNFVQDGDIKTTSEDVKSSGVLSVKTVKDSGKYTFKYRLTDGLEPLWYYDGTPSNSVDIKIEKGKLDHMTLKDFKISTSTIPYFGKKLEDIDFTVSMFNNGKKEVQLASMRWQSTIGKVDTKGTNTKKIVLCPTDTDNYEEEYVFDATFESQSLVIIFNMAQISQKVEVEVEYGQN
ncbi:MAG: hypothetical protein K2L52_07095, partial [Clostridia bacterium]|nr:hypothetical protein [Clostridia bacterium]